MDKATFRGSPELCLPRHSTFHVAVSLTFTSDDCLCWSQTEAANTLWTAELLIHVHPPTPVSVHCMTNPSNLLACGPCTFQFSISVMNCTQQRVWQLRLVCVCALCQGEMLLLNLQRVISEMESTSECVWVTLLRLWLQPAALSLLALMKQSAQQHTHWIKKCGWLFFPCKQMKIHHRLVTWLTVAVERSPPQYETNPITW